MKEKRKNWDDLILIIISIPLMGFFDWVFSLIIDNRQIKFFLSNSFLRNSVLFKSVYSFTMLVLLNLAERGKDKSREHNTVEL